MRGGGALSGHLQTLLGHFAPSETLASTLGVTGEKHLVTLEDGERISGYLYRGSSDYVVSLFHGLSGDVFADYLQRTAIQYLARHHSVFLVNHRGVGEDAGLAVKPYHSGRAEDISSVVGFLKNLLPQKKQITVGFSMSGNMVLCLLSGRKGSFLPDGAITVNAPINLKHCSVRLSEGFNRVYDLRFVRRLIEQRNLEISKWSRLVDIDNHFTAPLSGYRDGDHYYEVCSSMPHVGNIKTPTHVLAAADDPFIPVSDYEKASWSEAVRLKIQPHGGHLGYLSRRKNKLGNRRWLDQYLVDSLEDLLRIL